VQIVLATNWLAGFGGSETYLLTVAEELRALGHEPTIHARELGEMAQFARRRGIPVASEEELPDRCDAVLAQDGVTSCSLAARYPDTPQIFVAHSLLFDLQAPPQVDGLVSRVVVLNDRLAARMGAMASELEVVRLRQPVDLRRFSPRGDIRREPKRALLLGNHLSGLRREIALEACSALDIECEQTGLYGTPDPEPERLMTNADIVIGCGRAILEGMACGCATLLYDNQGGHGWVRPESYPAIEANGFTGHRTGPILNRAGLHAELAAYEPEMGHANRELMLAHHSARHHAVELVGLMREIAPSERRIRPGALREMARLQAMSWRHEAAANEREREASELRVRVEELEGEAWQLRRRLEATRSSRRYRIGSVLAKPADLWRRVRGDGSYSQEP
jgi:hypothetical protein